jgi:hypothetical protein
MEFQDNERFKAAIKTLALNAGVEIEEDKLKIYFMALEEFEIDQVEKSCAMILRTWKYNTMPTVAHIIEGVEGQQPNLEDKAMVCANKVIEHLRIHGRTKELEGALDDPVAMQLMTRRWPYYNWAQIILEEDLKWWVKDFCAAYVAEVKSDNIEIPHTAKPLIDNLTKKVEEKKDKCKKCHGLHKSGVSCKEYAAAVAGKV